jgi:hypothetical protein
VLAGISRAGPSASGPRFGSRSACGRWRCGLRVVQSPSSTRPVAGADPSPPRQWTSPCSRAATSELDRQLLAIPATTYVPALTGRQPNRAGKVCCPFHDDGTPSVQLYDHGWYCFACRVGGSIYDFGALLWLTGQSSDERTGWKLRGREFLWVRQRLASIFLATNGTITTPASIGSADTALTARSCADDGVEPLNERCMSRDFVCPAAPLPVVGELLSVGPSS